MTRTLLPDGRVQISSAPETLQLAIRKTQTLLRILAKASRKTWTPFRILAKAARKTWTPFRILAKVTWTT